MDEEEELDITLIGQEEAPAIDTGDALMGAGQPMFTADSNVVAAVDLHGQRCNFTTVYGTIYLHTKCHTFKGFLQVASVFSKKIPPAPINSGRWRAAAKIGHAEIDHYLGSLSVQ